MSTILDALQKARREHAQEGADADSLDRLTAAQAGAPRRTPRRSVAAVVILTIAATVLTLLLVGAAFMLLNQRMHSLVSQPPSGAGIMSGAPSSAPPEPMPDSPPPALPAASAPVSASVELPVAGPVPSADPAALLPPPVPAAQVPPAATPQPAAAAPPAASDGFTLGSILYDDQVRIATVNGVALHEGEEYSGIRVLRIMRDSVIVQRDRDDPVTLRLAR